MMWSAFCASGQLQVFPSTSRALGPAKKLGTSSSCAEASRSRRKPCGLSCTLLAGSVVGLHRLRRCLQSNQSRSTSTMSTPPLHCEALLFDIDGTLADTDPVHFQTFVDVLKEEGFNSGVPIDEDFFKQRIAGRQNRQICADLFPEWSVERADAFSNHKEATFRARAAEQLQPMTGLDLVRDWCDERALRKIAVTNAPRLNAEFILDCIGYQSWFPDLVIGDECERGKPDPCPYLTGMQRLGVRPERCIAFEDSPSGAASSVAAGVFTVGILTSQAPEKLQAAGCALLVSSFKDERLWKLLSQISTEEQGKT
ncbi:unnamed protein product [Effrenium voratum]|nr:unnamed protein product [Effrenium voratum]CAJ1426561.1 unnamed protein product [Effrenium voratum]